MQAILSVNAIKSFTRALAALSKYGDDLDILATPERLDLFATNSSKSAFGRFRIAPDFFEKYKVGTDAVRNEFDFGQIPDEEEGDDVAEVPTAAGQVLVKSILSILRHRGFEKSVEKCELAIVPGRLSSATQQASGTTTSTNASYQSVLLFRLHCKHGVTKTHRLSLSTPSVSLAPHIPTSPNQSHVVVGPRAIKDLIDHFAKTKGKGVRGGDLQLIWAWGAGEVKVRTLRGITQGALDSHIATSIVVEADEFDDYGIYDPPVSLSFHLREFIAATTLAENFSLQLNLTFTEPAAPLTITIDSHHHESLFVLSTRQAPASAQDQDATGAPVVSGGNKRPRETDTSTYQKRKSMKVVTEEPISLKFSKKPQPPVTARSSNSRGSETFRAPDPPSTMHSQTVGAGPSRSTRSGASPQPMPLFHPSSQPSSQRAPRADTVAQLTQAEQEALHASGLALDRLSAAEIADMLRDDDEDFGMDIDTKPAQPTADDRASWRDSPDWDVPELKESGDMPAAGLRAPNGMGLSEEEIREMAMDPDADVDEDEDDSFLPLTQTAQGNSSRQSKRFEPLDFGDD